jgi:hypothetical protein
MEKNTKQSRAEEMFTMIKISQESGMSKKAYCEQQGLALSNYYYWQKRYRASQHPTQGKFIPLNVVQGIDSLPQIEICYPNGVRLRLPQSIELSVIRSMIGII